MPNHELFETNPPKVICLGEALVDRLGPLGGDPLEDKNVEDCLGGAPANVACGLARLGIDVAFVGRLGKDWIGDSFITLMSQRGVNLQGLQIDNSCPSRIVLVRRSIDGERVFHGFLGDIGKGFSDQFLSKSHLAHTWPLISRKAQWLVIGTIPLARNDSAQALLWSVEKALLNGINIALDVNWRPTFWDLNFHPDSGPNQTIKNKINTLLNSAALIKLSREEAIYFFNKSNPIDISKSLDNQPDIVVTDGAKTVKWCIGGFVGETETFSPPVVLDTTGAGDAFTAGLLQQIILLSQSNLNQERIQEIIRFAAACGAFVCGRAGAIDPQPSLDDIEKYISEL